MNWFLKVLRQYADFKGRARRKEYWYFALFVFLFQFLAMGIDNKLGIAFDIAGQPLHYGPIYLILVLALFIPGLAVCVRRLHDIGKSGWWYLIALIPLLGFIILIIFFLRDSQPGTNQWGPNPKEVSPTPEN